MVWGDTHTFMRYVVSTVFGIFFQAFWPLSQPRSCMSPLNQHFLKASFVCTDDSWATPVIWGWKVPKQRQYKQSKTMWFPLYQLSQMNNKTWEKEKAELLLYKENIWEGKVRVSVDTKSQEPGLQGTVSMSVELSISTGQLWDFTRQCTECSNPQPYLWGKKTWRTE